MKVTVKNQYYEREYIVVESKQAIEQCIRNVHYGNEEFLYLHTKDGLPLTISPKACSCIEFEADTESEGKE